jgi:hypothetical protein
MKFLEVRDAGTTIPIIAFSIAETLNTDSEQMIKREKYYNHTGYNVDSGSVFVIKLVEPSIEFDSYNWNEGRTMIKAHQYIEKHYNELNEFDVIDVQYIMGETKQKKNPELINNMQIIYDK